MADLTLVSCLAPCFLGERDVEAAVELLAPLLASRLPLVLYVEEGWADQVRAGGVHAAVRLRDTSASRRWAAFARRAELEAAWAAAPPPGRPPLDHCVTRLTKMGMLHDQSVWDPFGTRYLAWIDPDVAASVHPGYLTNERLLEALPCLLRRFLLLARPSPVTDAAGRPDASRVQAQLFGGEADAIAEVNALYYQRLERRLRDGVLPTDESLLSELLAHHPEHFDRFVLQENGLLGALFEAMRGGRVAIERTRVY